jgi:hypothetical protein
MFPSWLSMNSNSFTIRRSISRRLFRGNWKETTEKFTESTLVVHYRWFVNHEGSSLYSEHCFGHRVMSMSVFRKVDTSLAQETTLKLDVDFVTQSNLGPLPIPLEEDSQANGTVANRCFSRPLIPNLVSQWEEERRER